MLPECIIAYKKVILSIEAQFVEIKSTTMLIDFLAEREDEKIDAAHVCTLTMKPQAEDS